MRTEGVAGELRAASHIAAIIWLVLAAAMVLTAVVDLFAGGRVWKVFVISAGLVTVLGGLIAIATSGPAPRASARFGFLLVVTLWCAAPLAATTPFVVWGAPLADAAFEAVSGLTTTGATVLSGLDTMPRGLLFWRALMHWLGGVGILALGLVLLPFLQIGGMQLFSKESSDRSDKPLPRFAPFARTLMGVYITATILCAMGFSAFGMDGFDAVTHAFSTVATGGFANYDTSLEHFDSDGVLWVASLFMIVGALPFAMFIAVAAGRPPKELDPQVPVFFLIIVAASVALTLARGEDGFAAHAIAESVFNVISIVTTTGFAAEDYQSWGDFSIALFFLLMFTGGCAGSTSGGVKTYRFIVVASLLRAHLRNLMSPSAVTLTRYGKRQVDPAVFRSALVFLAAFALSLAGFTLALAATGLDLITAHTAALSALGNIGPGLGPIIGPAGNFGPVPDAAKWLMCFAMIMGRLEILPILVLLSVSFWRR